jgi:glycosyltransferase involved in cell wall biosynthesis
MSAMSSWAALGKKCPMVHSVHGLYHDPYLVKDVNDPFGAKIRYDNMQQTFGFKLKNWFCHLPIFRADMILPQNRFEFDELVKFGISKEKMKIVPTSGIKLDNWKKKGSFRDKYNINGKMILFVGQPIRRKGPEYLIKAMLDIVKVHPDIRLVFVGYRRNERIERLCERIRNNVIFVGFLEEQDKINAYFDADVFCLPTLYEGFGLVYLEAMAAKTPIVTTDTPGIAELVEDGQGVLVKPKDSTTLANAVVDVLTSRKRWDFSKVKNYDWSKIAKKIEGVYEDVIQK